MDITEKNGQPSMEEILASIRRIIAEEPSGPPPGIDISSRISAMSHETGFDEAADFDLPAIFRTNPNPAPEKPALFGRLTDAIRGATSALPETKAARNGDDYSGADHHEHNGSNGNGRSAPPHYPSLSTLRTARSDQPAPENRPAEVPPLAEQPKTSPFSAPPTQGPATGSPFTGWFGRPPEPAPQAIREEIKRVMSPFKDTRFKQMAHDEQAAAPEAPHVPAPAPAPVPTFVQAPAPVELPRVDFTSIIPARMDVPGIPVVEEYRWPPHAPTPLETSFGTPPRPEHTSLPPEPPHYIADAIAPIPFNPLGPGYFDPSTAGRLPQSHDEQVVPFRPQPPPQQAQVAPTGTIEDTTAELLRPMLRQWLADNMPRMVEKALHIEVAESVRTGRKLPGQ